MPPDLFDVIDACPTTKTWRTKSRPGEPDLAGAGDRALLLIGFVAALRRSEPAAITLDDLDDHPNGRCCPCPDPRQPDRRPDRTRRPAPPTRTAAQSGPSNTAGTVHDHHRAAARAGAEEQQTADRPLHPVSINIIVQAAIARAGIIPDGYSAHRVRAGFVTYAHLRGAIDRAIAHQTRHRSLASLGGYVRIHQGMGRQRRHHARVVGPRLMSGS